MIKAFKMKLYAGMAEEYERRHNALWQEMSDMIYAHGGRNYSIYFDAETNSLFAIIEITDERLWAKSAETEICKKWWAYMADIMETNEDNSPVTTDMKLVFHMI